jgi:DNA-binding transcriptional LysR family regulator
LPFNLNQLETFRRLAHEENFTRTAELLNLTPRAEQLLGNVDALEREMREFADVRAGELRVGATVTIGTYTLPDLVAFFEGSFPAIDLRVEVGNTAAMALAVKVGRVSLALVEGPLVDDELEIEPYANDELVLVVPRSHALAQRSKPIAADDLANVRFVFREEGSGTRSQVERTLLDAGITPKVALTLPSGEGIVRAVELGIGVAIVSRLVVDAPVRAGRIAQVRLRGLEFRRTFRVVRLRRQTPSPAALAFTALLHDGKT